MLLSLSSGALPESDIEGLIEACEHRGFVALELREGDGHGVAPEATGDMAGSLTSLGILAGTNLRVAGYEIDGPGDATSDVRLRGLAAIGGALDTMLVVGARSSAEIAHRISMAARLRAMGVDAGIVVRGETAVEEAGTVHTAGFPFVWEVDASWEPVGQRAQALLPAYAAAMRYVRLLGAGPESELHTGSGIGQLFGLLAQGRFGRPVVLAPSTPAYRSAWERWLGRRTWGCGGASGAGLPVSGSRTPLRSTGCCG